VVHRCVPLLGAIALLAPGAALANDPLAGRPAFSYGEEAARSAARCGDLRAMSAGLPPLEQRVSLTISGELTAIQTDGALWYLVMCASPDVRVLCVTYESNDMKRGDPVLFRGGYSRVDEDHVALDPCLASRVGR
jgi:hypothetical protein